MELEGESPGVVRLRKEVSLPEKKPEKRRIIRVKMRISVTIENEDGSAFVDPTTVEVGVPEVEAFTSPQVFDQVFYRYEQAVLEARNDIFEEATENYLSAMGKKKHSRSKKCKEEN
jgi:hypothetical protein